MRIDEGDYGGKEKTEFVVAISCIRFKRREREKSDTSQERKRMNGSWY